MVVMLLFFIINNQSHPPRLTRKMSFLGVMLSTP